MERIRPDNADPIPLRKTPHNVGKILVRFAGLLIIAIVGLAVIWLR